MLCQFLWRKELEEQRARELESKGAGGAEKAADDDAAMQEEKPENDADPEAHAETADTNAPPPLFDSPAAETKAYEEYAAKHCLSYVRTFFNSHLDDPWFRARLSPLEQCRAARKERARAAVEAGAMKKEIVASLEEADKGAIPKKDEDGGHLPPAKCGFVAGCRLGAGTKPTASGTGPDVLPGEEDRNLTDRHPARGHLHSFVRNEACVRIVDVPPHVSDEQLLATLADHCGSGEAPRAVYSDDVCVPTHDRLPLDPYHRTAFAVFSSDVDADGRGGAPPSADTKDEGAGRLPTRRCTVFVATAPLAETQPVSVLSAAVSSRGRISKDKEDAAALSSLLDEARGIPAGSRLEDLLALLYPGNERGSVDDEDLLDVSIAYLRRVHLLSFYNGCAAADKVGNVLSHADHAGTIHLRLKDADDIIAKYEEEEPAAVEEDEAEAEKAGEGGAESTTSEGRPDAAKDLLVSRLNDSVARALDRAKSLAARGPASLVDPPTDAAARDVETAESAARETWIERHHIRDADGRARCAFHWCRKLFKDADFLRKHLLKKHADQLRGECAKCHDGPMMGAWDEEEPELWKEEQARMAAEERRRREREERDREREEEDRRRREAANAGEKRKSHFVDPDEMVEETVELRFEHVEAAAAPPKKKRRKKKSLL
ncbi:hypothetical protein ACHAXT_004631 [Thalassiosira profunda]